MTHTEAPMHTRAAGRFGGAIAARLRHAIDSGRTGDKVAAFDPAAAPLGTDEEAAGTPVIRSEPPAPREGGQPSAAALAGTAGHRRRIPLLLVALGLLIVFLVAAMMQGTG